MDTQGRKYYKIISLWETVYYAVTEAGIVKIISRGEIYTISFIPSGQDAKERSNAELKGQEIDREEYIAIFRLAYQKIINPIRNPKKTEK